MFLIFTNEFKMKLIFQTGNGILQTGNGIIYPVSRPPIKKLLLQNVFHLNQGVQNWFSKQEMELSKQQMKLFIPFPTLWPKKLLLQHLLHIYQRVQNWFSKQEMGLSKKEMELFLLLPGLWSKTSFTTSSSYYPRSSNLGLKIGNGNYPNRIWNYFSQFWASDQKTTFTTFSLYLPRNTKLNLKTRNLIILPPFFFTMF